MPCTPVPDSTYLELQREQAVLLRGWGRMQQRLGARLTRLENENLKLRAALLVLRTSWLWGLGPPPALSAAPQSVAAEEGAPSQPSDPLCQVACAGHAHAWLDDNGQCRRTGDTCQSLARQNPS